MPPDQSWASTVTVSRRDLVTGVDDLAHAAVQLVRVQPDLLDFRGRSKRAQLRAGGSRRFAELVRC